MNNWEIFGVGVFVGIFVGVWIAYILNMIGERRNNGQLRKT